MAYASGVDVIVVNYRTPSDLRDFVDSYDSFSGNIPSNLIIANVSPNPEDFDLGEELVETQLNPTQHLVFEDNVGYARAVNDSATGHNSRIIAAFNADTRLTEGTLEKCYYALVNNPDWGVLGPRQVDRSGRITHAGIFGTMAVPRHRAWRKKDKPEYGDVQQAVTVSGSAYFIKREVWDILTRCEIYRQVCPEATGAFLPTPLFYEETWCSYHTQAHNYKVMYYGEAMMYHEWHVSIKKNGKEGWAARQFQDSRDLFRKACDSHDLPHD